MWEGEFPATCAGARGGARTTIASYKPDAKSRTAWELATHLATADIWFLDSILNGAFEWNPDAAKQAEAQFKSVERHRRVLQEDVSREARRRCARCRPRSSTRDARLLRHDEDAARRSSSASPTITASTIAASSRPTCARWARRCRTSTAAAPTRRQRSAVGSQDRPDRTELDRHVVPRSPRVSRPASP